jgi:hypothetical protein
VNLFCVICHLVNMRAGEPRDVPAVTVANGHATCETHLGYAMAHQDVVAAFRHAAGISVEVDR